MIFFLFWVFSSYRKKIFFVYVQQCSYSNDNFKVGCDWSRVSFSRDISRIAAGSSDGAIFIWNINGHLEATLKENS